MISWYEADGRTWGKVTEKIDDLFKYQILYELKLQLSGQKYLKVIIYQEFSSSVVAREIFK